MDLKPRRQTSWKFYYIRTWIWQPGQVETVERSRQTGPWWLYMVSESNRAWSLLTSGPFTYMNKLIPFCLLKPGSGFQSWVTRCLWQVPSWREHSCTFIVWVVLLKDSTWQPLLSSMQFPLLRVQGSWLWHTKDQGRIDLKNLLVIFGDS